MKRLSVLGIGDNLRLLLQNNPCPWYQIPILSYADVNLISRKSRISSSFFSPPTTLRPFSTFIARTISNSVILSQRLVPNRIISFIPSPPSTEPDTPPSTASGPSNIVLVESEAIFKKALSRAQDKRYSRAEIFFFTHSWLYPCRAIAPVVLELAEKYPHVTIYKIEIDNQTLHIWLEHLIAELEIKTLPTLQLYRYAAKVSVISTLDMNKLKDVMEEHYKVM